MTELRLSGDDLAGAKTDALIVGVARRDGKPVLVPGAGAVDKAMRGKLLAALIAAGATGKRDEITRLATLGTVKAATLVAVGLGDAPAGRSPRWEPEAVRRAVGAAVRALAGSGAVATALAEAATHDGVRAVAEGARLGGYAFTRYRHAS